MNENIRDMILSNDDHGVKMKEWVIKEKFYNFERREKAQKIVIIIILNLFYVWHIKIFLYGIKLLIIPR